MPRDNFQSVIIYPAACKHWSALLATGVLLGGAIAKLPLAVLLWAAAPILLLGVVEAATIAQEKRYAEVAKGKRQQAQGTKENDGEKELMLPPEPAGESLVRTVVAFLSPAIWPFYLGLYAIVGFGGSAINAPAPSRVASASSGCGAGGCGTASGCGTSGCGASTGRGCGCGSSRTATTSASQSRPAPPTYRGVPPSAAPKPTFVPVSAVQGNRPAPTLKPVVTIQPPRPTAQAPASRPTITIPAAAAPAAAPAAKPAAESPPAPAAAPIAPAAPAAPGSSPPAKAELPASTPSPAAPKP